MARKAKTVLRPAESAHDMPEPSRLAVPEGIPEPPPRSKRGRPSKASLEERRAASAMAPEDVRPLTAALLGAIAGVIRGDQPTSDEVGLVNGPPTAVLNKYDFGGKFLPELALEDVVWTNFAQVPVKIVDEINRLPETKQSIILDGVDRGNWEYLNEMIINDEYCLFATDNYQDGGTNSIIAPLVDRFDVIVESRYPGPNLSFLIGKTRKKDHVLRHPKYEKDLYRVLKSKIAYEKKIPKAEAVCNAFGDYVHEKLGVKPLRREDRDQIRNEMESLDIDLDASAFTRMLLSELCSCDRYGQKRIVENCEEGCHYTGYIHR